MSDSITIWEKLKEIEEVLTSIDEKLDSLTEEKEDDNFEDNEEQEEEEQEEENDFDPADPYNRPNPERKKQEKKIEEYRQGPQAQRISKEDMKSITKTVPRKKPVQPPKIEEETREYNEEAFDDSEFEDEE